MMSVTLFESLIILIVAGAGVVAWWGIRRLVKASDDMAERLNKIDKSLATICERLGKSDIWMIQHEKSDDERHKEMKGVYTLLSNLLLDSKNKKES